MATIGTAQLQQQLQQVRDATAKYLPTGNDLMLEGQSVKVSDILSALDATLGSLAQVTEARAALQQALDARTQKTAATARLLGQLKAYLRATCGKASPQLGSFGFTLKPRTPLTSEQRALRAAKARLTRKARGTLGPKQKLEITADGRPGLLLVDASGTPIPGVLTGPTAPGLPLPPIATAPPTAASGALPPLARHSPTT